MESVPVYGYIQHVKSASYFESGIGRGMGFRDSNQDLLDCTPDTRRARERLLTWLQLSLKMAVRTISISLLPKKGNNEIGSNFNDDPLWLILATAAYIKETGDYFNTEGASSVQQ